MLQERICHAKMPAPDGNLLLFSVKAALLALLSKARSVCPAILGSVSGIAAREPRSLA